MLSWQERRKARKDPGMFFDHACGIPRSASRSQTGSWDRPWCPWNTAAVAFIIKTDSPKLSLVAYRLRSDCEGERGTCLRAVFVLQMCFFPFD